MEKAYKLLFKTAVFLIKYALKSQRHLFDALKGAWILACRGKIFYRVLL